MSKIIQTLSDTRHDGTIKSHVTKQSLESTNTNTNYETNISTITGYENDLGDKLEQLNRVAEIQAQQIELSECLMLVAQLVHLFKHTVIMSELQKQNDWHHETRNHLRQHNGATSNIIFDNKLEKIVIDKGLTTEQWNCLLYISFSNGDTMEITKLNRKHLQKIHDKAVRLLETDERNAVFALIKAIETHMSHDHLIDK